MTAARAGQIAVWIIVIAVLVFLLVRELWRGIQAAEDQWEQELLESDPEFSQSEAARLLREVRGRDFHAVVEKRVWFGGEPPQAA